MEATLNGPSGRITLENTELTIGRAPGNKLVISDARASSRHALIRPAYQGYELLDMGSTNGTFVNEQRLTANVAHSLQAGDVIRIGDSSFTYEVSGVFQVEPTIYSAAPQNQSYDATVAAPPPVPYGGEQNPAYNVPPAPSYNPTPQQPAYNQQAYNAPPQQPGYQQAPALPSYPGYQQPPKKSRRGLWITLGILAAVLVLACGACGAFFLYAAANASTPDKTLDAFCNGLVTKNTKQVREQLTASQQAQTSEDSVKQVANATNSCTHDAAKVNGDTATSTITLTVVTAAGNSPLRTVASLERNSDSVWKISNLQQQQ